MPADSQPGPRPVWNWLAVAFAVGVLVVLFAPAAPELRERSTPTTRPGQTITLDELQALLTDSPGETPPSVVVETPDGPVTVIVPPTSTTTTSTAPPTSTPVPSTTTSTSTTAPPRPLPTANDLLENLLGQSIPTTIPEGAGGDP